MADVEIPDAEVLIAEGCPHCPAALQAMTELLKQGRIGRLVVINLSRHPEEGESRGVRGVPWLRIGPFELAGAYGPAELETWVERAGSEEGRAAYLSDQLEAGELDKVTALSGQNPTMLNPLFSLAADLETPFAVRIGVGAVLEALGPQGRLGDQVEAINSVLGHSEHAQVRADAAHFLGLTGTAAARSALERLAKDPDASVREIAAESLEQLP